MSPQALPPLLENKIGYTTTGLLLAYTIIIYQPLTT